MRTLNESELHNVFLEQLEKVAKKNDSSLKEANRNIFKLVSELVDWPSTITIDGEVYYSDRPCFNMRDGRIGMTYENSEGKAAKYIDWTIEKD